MPALEHRNSRRGLRICLLSYRSNPHCGGQGVYLRNLSRALVISDTRWRSFPGRRISRSWTTAFRLIQLPGLDLYNPEDLFRMPSLANSRDPVNLVEWLGVSTMGFSEPLTFGMRAFRFSEAAEDPLRCDPRQPEPFLRRLGHQGRIPTVATIHHPITVDRDSLAIKAEVRSWRKKLKQLRWYSFIGMQKRVARTFASIITVSECARADISREFRIRPHRFRVVPNGINTEHFLSHS